MYAYAKVQIDPSSEAHSAGDGPDYLLVNKIQAEQMNQFGRGFR